MNINIELEWSDSYEHSELWIEEFAEGSNVTDMSLFEIDMTGLNMEPFCLLFGCVHFED